MILRWREIRKRLRLAGMEATSWRFDHCLQSRTAAFLHFFDDDGASRRWFLVVLCCRVSDKQNGHGDTTGGSLGWSDGSGEAALCFLSGLVGMIWATFQRRWASPVWMSAVICSRLRETLGRREGVAEDDLDCLWSVFYYCTITVGLCGYFSGSRGDLWQLGVVQI